MRQSRTAFLTLLITLAFVPGALAGQSASTRWAASRGDFTAWHLSGASRMADGSLQLLPGQAWAGTDPYGPGGYYGGTYYNGGSFVQAEVTGPIVTSSFGFREAIASYEASTPAGSWVEPMLRVQVNGAWTKWYSLGVWASDGSTVSRHSVASQSDAVAYVSIDTLVISAKQAATAYQARVRLFSKDNVALPSLHAGAVTVSTSPAKNSTLPPGNPARWNTVLPVPQCSQMVYPDGGTVWCSPTSTAMVLRYWAGDTNPACETHVRAALGGVYDWYYRGYGNWPFNTAYAATQGFQAHVARFSSFAQLEPWLSAGVPAIISVAWGRGDLTGAPISSSNGHLMVIVGFDAVGNPVVNDPAAASNSTVRRTYYRSELEPLWQSASAGTTYLIYPQGWTVPAL
jgi:hypothetical protein